jgi:flagellin-like protein
MLISKKAISPILATLLLIVIAVAAIVVTYAWIMTYVSSAGQKGGVMLYPANVKFYIEGSTKKIDLDIGNSGTSDTTILKVYCGSTIGNMTEQTPTQSLPLTLTHGQVVKITINYEWTAGATYYFKVVSSTGQTLGPWNEQASVS